MASTQAPNKKLVGKKLVVGCDGTWMNSDMLGQVPSNVTRFIRALRHHTDDGISQIAYYQRGVGTDDNSNIVASIEGNFSGLTGDDISEHIREAYAFITNNFNPETQEHLDQALKGQGKIDEIFLVGFSRGAYTARCIADLITRVGLLTKRGMEEFYGVFGDWMNQNVEKYNCKWFLGKFPSEAKDFAAKHGRTIKYTDPEYMKVLMDKGLTRWGMPIRAIGVWDTVGALGIPLPFDKKNVKPYSFVNTKVAQHVEHAFHAMAIDEHRQFFSPTLWEQPTEPHKLDLLKQVWFPGSHSNIGGSYDDAGQSNITLAWMISQFEQADAENGGILSFDITYLEFIQDLSIDYYAKVNEPARPWGFGRLYDSSLVDSAVSFVENQPKAVLRTPGKYHEVDAQTGIEMTDAQYLLKNTNESVHPCVRIRQDGHGKGSEELVDSSRAGRLLTAAKITVGTLGGGYHPKKAEMGTYVPPALSPYVLQKGPDGKDRVWYGKEGIPEEVMGKTEMRLMERLNAKVGRNGVGHSTNLPVH